MTRREHAARIHLVDVDNSDSATLMKFHREVLCSNFRPDQMMSEDAFLAAQRSDVLRTVLAWDSFMTRNSVIRGFASVSMVGRVLVCCSACGRTNGVPLLPVGALPAAPP